MIVVTLVRNTGWKLIRRLSTIAARRLAPRRISWNMVTSRWIESAMAMVRMMVGAFAETGVSAMPAQPASPIAITVDRPITISVTSVPANERSSAAVTASSTTYISGTSACRSASAASVKA